MKDAPFGIKSDVLQQLVLCRLNQPTSSYCFQHNFVPAKKDLTSRFNIRLLVILHKGSFITLARLHQYPRDDQQHHGLGKGDACRNENETSLVRLIVCTLRRIVLIASIHQRYAYACTCIHNEDVCLYLLDMCIVVWNVGPLLASISVPLPIVQISLN